MSDSAVAPLGLREILDEPVRFLRQHFKTLAGIAVIGDGVALIPGLIYQLVSGGKTPDLSAPEEFGRFMLLTYGTVATQMLIWLTSTVALYAAVKRILEGRTPTAGECYATALSPGFYFTYLLGWLALLPGFLCCGLPSVAVALLLALLGPVMVYEGSSFWAAMKRSGHLVWFNPTGQWAGSIRLATFLAGVVYWAIFMALNTIASLPSAIWGGIAGFSAAAQGQVGLAMEIPVWLVLLGTALGFVTKVVTDLYPAVVFTMIYREAVRRTEGVDLETAIRGRLES